MYTRKVQTVGSGTYTVSLPKDWARSAGIDAGDTVNLHTHIDGTLALQAEEREDETPGRTTMRVGPDDVTSLERTIRAAYAAGTKEIRLEATDGFTAEQRRVVDRVARTLTGVSVTEESESKLTVRTLLDTEEVSVRQSVRQLAFVALSMHRDATAVLTAGTGSGTVADRNEQVDRLYAMIDRSFARGLARLDEVDSLGLTRPELFELWATTRELERVADHAGGIETAAGRIADSIDASVTEEIREIAQRAREVVTDAVDVVLGDSDAETARQALDARDRLREDIGSFERRLDASSADESQLELVLERLRRTAEHGGTVAEYGLRHAIYRGELSEPSLVPNHAEDSERESHASTGG